MAEFNPWGATHAEARQAIGGDAEALTKWAVAGYVTAQKTHFEQHPIHGVGHCLRAGLSVPDWLAHAFLAGFKKLESCTVASFDEAFGNVPVKGKHLATRRLERQHRMAVEVAFMLADAPPRTPAGRRAIGQKLGLTEKQVRTLLPTNRSNTKGHKAYGASGPPILEIANDPFGLTRAKVPEK